MGIRELKQNASEVVAWTRAGDTVTITDRGNEVAMMIPYPKDDLLRMELEGKIVRPKVRFDPALLKPIEIDGLSIQEVLDESRGDRV